MNLNDFILKIGYDKLLHFSFGGLICSLITIPMIIQDGISISTLFTPFIGFIVVVILETFKEKLIDEVFDKKDFIATLLGTVPVFIMTSLGVLFHFLSN